ncbi:MAG TPA: formylmethanofuran--tetrahydromethanopterin N-formyltransferase, partial [Planctomycetaceae bacterium]|nr:formylmethanofuran--tetrahydromethanopterin N-formyltransferase [Planctomycetaceae bacterium]
MLRLHGVDIEDTFAEAFSTAATRVLITAETAWWARVAAIEMTGYGTSVIGCDAEAGIEGPLAPDETPDGRPGISVLLFAFSREALAQAVTKRVGQCVLTCPTTACYNGLPDAAPEKRISVGGQLRYFGDGFQSSKKLGPRRLWRIPVMDGEFVCEEWFGTVRGVAGGNLLIGGVDQGPALEAAEAAVSAIEPLAGVITPFPGGIVRSGSKVGSRYPKLRASTNDAYCPTLRAVTKSALPPEVGAVYEIIIDGLDIDAVRDAMRAGLHAAARCPGLVRITAGNYGGRLGQHHLYLKDL